MRKAILIFLMLCVSPLIAQVTTPQVLYVSSVPSGSCLQAPPIQIINTTGVIYTCVNGTWGTPGGGSPYNPSSVAITGGTINGTTIGLTTPAAADFTSLNGVGASEEVVASSATPAFSRSVLSSIITLATNVTSWTLGPGQYGGQQHIITWCENSGGGFTVAGSPSNIRGAFNPFPSTTASTCSTQAYVWSSSSSYWYALSAGSVNQ